MMPEPFRFALEKYLKEAGHLRPVRLGEAPVLPEPVNPGDLDQRGPNGEAQKNEAFARYAEDGAGSRDSILWVCVAMLIAVFLLGILAVVLAFRGLLAQVGSLAGLLVVLLAIVGKMQRVLSEAIAMDLTAVTLRRMPPEQAIKVLELIYWNLKKASSRDPVSKLRALVRPGDP